MTYMSINQYALSPKWNYFYTNFAPHCRSWLKLSDDLDGALSSMHVSPAAGAMLIDKPVLARRTSDGLYYKGRVKSQVINALVAVTAVFLFVKLISFSSPSIHQCEKNIGDFSDTLGILVL